MPRREIKLTDTQARILALLIVIFSVGFVGFSLATFLLVKSRERVRIEIVELPPTKIEVPQTEQEFEEPIVPEQLTGVYQQETYDYKKLLLEATEMVEKGVTVSTYVLEPNEALGVIRAADKPFLITEISSETCCISIVGGHKLQDKREYTALYGVFVLSSTNKDSTLEKMLALRSAGYPSYMMKFTRDGRDWFTVVVGAFPTIELAEEFNKNLNWNEVMRISGTSKVGYAGRISP
uniref:SPOR domain-containing protein n=1 Tax=Pseudothermotoga hypogea TaxID=57487 RepID=A0A832IFG7_9THEM